MNAAVRTIIEQRETGFPNQCAEFARGAEILFTATRSWGALPPTSREEIDAVSRQLQGLQHSLVTLRSVGQK